MKYVIITLLLGLCIYIIVSNTIAIVNKIKEKKIKIKKE